MSKHFNVNEAAANDSRAMEARNHFKNGETPKILKSRKKFNMFKYALLFIAGLMVCSISCKKDKDTPDTPDEPGGGTETGLYMGIIGFNENITPKTIGLLNNSNKGEFQSFVNGLTTKSATGLYYAVDNAITMLQKSTKPDDLVSVSLVTFTDGLDNFSIELNKDYNSRDAYRDAVNNRIKSSGLKNFSAYSIGVKGGDVVDTEAFEAGLKALASNKDNVYQVKNMDEVNYTFGMIASSLYNESKTQSIKLRITGGYDDGTKIRFTFDNVTDAAASNFYIEGTYKRNGDARSLQNVDYKGLKSSSGTTITGELSSGYVTFTFKDVMANSGSTIDTKDVQQWEYVASQSRWQRNSEFGQSGDTETIVDKKSAVVMLVLDCTTSLDAGGANGSKEMKAAANNFIEVLLGNGAPIVHVTGVTLNKNTLELAEGGTEKLIVTIQPSNASNQTMTWTSSKPAVATVADGIVTAVAKGTADITVTTKDGNKTATCTVTVKAAALPVLSTTEATNVTANSATLGGNITDAGVPAYTENGICYATSENPTTSNNKTVASKPTGITGNYTTDVIGLSPNTTYYVRAYAINSAGTAYGKQVSFKTGDVSLPVLSTTEATNITANSATLGGNITNVGVPAYTEKGICYATSQNPTTSNTKKTVSGSGTGNYTTDVTGLSANTTYYVRSYAINSAGTAYGNQVSFKTTEGTTTAKVRFKKVLDYMYVTEMAVAESGSLEDFASYYFDTNAGTSPYYEIPQGNHVPLYYYTYSGSEGWYYCLESPYTYNFKAGRKYTVVCDDDGTYLTFYVTDDGVGKSSEFGTLGTIVSPITKIPKSQIKSLTERPKADVK